MSASGVDVFEQHDLVDLLGDEPELLAFADAIAQTQGSRQRPASHRRPSRLVLLLAASVVLLVAVGTGTAFAVERLTASPVTRGFSALNDPALPSADESVMALFLQLGSGEYATKQVGDGLYLAQRGDDLCAVAIHGFAGCTDHLDGDVWLQGDEGREYDSETAPFQVHIYGFARDDVAALRITTADGESLSLPVANNAFQTTIKNTSFSDITAIEIVYSSGQTTSLDPRRYFPTAPPVLTVITPTSTMTMTQTPG